MDRILDLLQEQERNVVNFRSEMPEWYRAVFSFKFPWARGDSNGPALDTGSLALLRAFALVIDMMGEGTPLSASQRTALSDALDEAKGALASDLAAVSEGERLYVMTLVEALRHALATEGPLDADALKRVVDQLNGALVGIAAQLSAVDDHDGAQKIVRIVGRITSATRSVVYDAAALATIVASVPIVQKMIEG